MLVSLIKNLPIKHASHPSCRRMKMLFFCVFLVSIYRVHAQLNITAQTYFNPITNTLSVRQTLQYKNTNQDTLHALYFNDWLNAFKNKTSPLGKHFSSIYVKQFRFSKLKERGETRIDFIGTSNEIAYQWIRLKKHPDIVKVILPKPLLPGATTTVKLRYTVRVPEDKFTGFGRGADGNYNLRYWLITPAVYKHGWQLYSNEDLNDQFRPACTVQLVFRLPDDYQIASGLTQQVLHDKDWYYKRVLLTGTNQTNFKLALTKVQDSVFHSYKTPYATVVTDIGNDKVPKDVKTTTINRILRFLQNRLGVYPHAKIFVTKADYKDSPIYGLNQLPSFIRPFPDGFQYDLEMMKTLTHKYLRTTLMLNPRKEAWLSQAIEIDLLMDYVNTFYPNTKLLGELSKVIGIRWSHLADLPFNAQYAFFFMNMNRLNLDQPLSMSRDSLVKFNQEIANPYKAGVGFKYLEDFLGEEAVKKSIKIFYQKYALKKRVHPQDFKRILEKNASKNIDWFFTEYVHTNVRLDFTIKKVTQIGDSLRVVIKNKEPNNMPVSLYGLHHKKVVAKYWVENTRGQASITIPKQDITKLALNYKGIIPEINQRNNSKNLRGLFNKPLQLRLIKDVEDPHYTQFFLMPEFAYNLYDGFTMGTRISNQAILRKRFTYHITPQYGFRSRALVGKLAFSYNQQFRNQNLSNIVYGLSANRFSYAHNLFYYRISPFVTFEWRHRDLRNRERQYLSARAISVHRQQSPLVNLTEKPNYKVLDLQYTYSDRGLVNTFASTVDYQLADKFSKVSLTAKYRKLFLNNWQLEFRLFAGAFLFNHTDATSHYFSFGLDRPSDYLFDYNYYGRSESSGLFSQQFIESEGGFKSKINPGFANRWLVTFNTSVSLWRDLLYIYGDVGMIKNAYIPVKTRFDSGVRLSIVQDYFELFFPVYSSLGWEVGQPHYDQKIRFIVTLDFDTLMGLFERTYY